MPEIREPDDGAMVVTIELGGSREIWWRDDQAARAYRGNDLHDTERWFADPDSDPLAWPQVLKYAETVHAVETEEMGVEACRAVSVWGNRCNLTPHHDAREHTDGHSSWTGDGESRATPADNARLLSALMVANEIGLPTDADDRHAWQPPPGGGWNCGRPVDNPAFPGEICNVIWSDRTRHYQDGETRG